MLHQLSGSTIDGTSYSLDNAGNRTSKTDQRASVTSNYGYDAIYQLTQVTQGANTTESYSFDPVGNRTASLGVSSYTTNSSNELTATPSTSYMYDSNGNTLTKVDSTGTTSYTWDFENRLTSATLPGSGGTVSFKYDPFGRRIEKTTSSTTGIYAYDGVNLVEEANSAGTVTARYSQTQNIDEPLAMLRSSTTSYYEADGLGSITSLTSGAGILAQTYTYDSFGKLVGSSGSLMNPFQYTGRESDTETGLYYYRARYYDPVVTGRFLSEDPLKFNAGVNFYAYVKNETIDFLDPFGLKCTQVTPWRLVPTMSAPGALKPYATVQSGLFWQPVSWDFVLGDGTSFCICDWVANNVRIRKFYREKEQEEAWFQCTGPCGKQVTSERETRSITREWETDEPGAPLWTPEKAEKFGPTVQPPGGGDPNKKNTVCLACMSLYRP